MGPMTKKNSSRLPVAVEKLFLTLIEDKGLPLNVISLLHLCDSNRALLGNKASTTRRIVQRYFSKLKVKTFEQYIRLLDSHSITYGLATQRLFQLLPPEEQELQQQEPADHEDSSSTSSNRSNNTSTSTASSNTSTNTASSD